MDYHASSDKVHNSPCRGLAILEIVLDSHVVSDILDWVGPLYSICLGKSPSNVSLDLSSRSVFSNSKIRASAEPFWVMSLLEDEQDYLLASPQITGISEPLRFGWQVGSEGS